MFKGNGLCTQMVFVKNIFSVYSKKKKNLTGTSATNENVSSHWTDFWVHMVIYY